MAILGSGHDTTIEALLRAADEADFARLLEGALAGVDQVIRDAIARTLRSHFRVHSGSRSEDIADLHGEAVVLLVRKLRQLRAGEATGSIEYLPAYAAKLATHACYNYLRRRYPQWTRLKNQVRYVVTHDRELALTTGDDGTSWCAVTAPRRAVPDVQPRALNELVKWVLQRTDGSMKLNELASAVAARLGIRDVIEETPIDDATEALTGGASDSRTEPLDQERFLKRLWEEVLLLPVRQRIALLLNLRDDRGRGVLVLFPLTGTAPMPQVADALAMPAAELERLWPELPLDDLRIAERLELSRQQVINLRKSARARLARRLAAERAGR